jgi:hypothetical protein
MPLDRVMSRAQGADPAQAMAAALSGSADSSQPAAAAALTATATAAGKASTELSEMHRQMLGARQAGFALEQVLRGNVGALGNMAFGAGKASKALMGISAAGAGFSIGWAVGSAIYKAGAALMEFNKHAEKSPRLTSAAREELEKLGQVKLTALDTEIRGIQQRLNSTLQSITALAGRTTDRMQAQSALDVAEMEATMPAGPGRDRAVAERKAKAREDVLAEEDRAAQQEITVANQAKAAAAAKLEQLQAEKDAAEAASRAASEKVLSRPADGSPASAEAAAARDAARIAAQVAADALTKQTPALNEQMTSADSAVAEANFRRGQIGLRRKTGAFETSSTMAGIAAGESRDALEGQLAQARESLAKATAAGKRGPDPVMMANATREAAEADAARNALKQFDETGEYGDGKRMSTRSFGAKKVRAGLQAEVAKEESEAAAAAEAIATSAHNIYQSIESIKTTMANLDGQIKNLR